MLDACTSRPRGFGLMALFALAALLIAAPAAADWEPESEFAENSTYFGLAGVLALANIGDKVGQNGSEPIRGISSAKDAFGVRFWIGNRPIPYLAFEIGFQYIAPIQITASGGRESVSTYTGSLDFKGYPLARVLDEVKEGRIQPYVVVSPSITGVSGTEINSPLAFTIGVGGGVDYWLDSDVSLTLDGRYSWGTSNLRGLDMVLVSLGARYHFY